MSDNKPDKKQVPNHKRPDFEFSRILDQIQDRITVTDLQGYISYINEAECAMLGMKREEIIGKHISIYGEDPSAGATQEEIIQNTLRNGEWRGEVINFDKNGNAIRLDVRTHIVKDAEGEPVALCGISTDITEQKKAEEALLQSESRLRSILNASHAAIVLLNRNGIILDSNEEHALRLNMSREQILGKCVWNLLPREVMEPRKFQVESVFKTGQSFVGMDERQIGRAHV